MPAVLKNNRAPKIEKAIAALTRDRVLVGVPAERDARRREKGEALNNAAIAYIQDNGAPEANIPARPFMRPGISDARPSIEGILRHAAQQAAKGDATLAHSALERVGTIAQRYIRRRITGGAFAPLKESTLRARRAKGFQGTKPLVVTGQLRRAITYVVRRARDAG